MALRLNDITAIISRTTGLVAANSDYSVAFWYQPLGVASGGNYLSPFNYTGAGGAFAGFFSDLGSDDHGLQVGDGVSTVVSSIVDIPADTKRHLAYVRSGNSHRFYVNGILIDTETLNVSTETWTSAFLGNDNGFADVPGIVVWDFVEWNAAKTVLVIQAQMATDGAPASLINLHTFTPLVSNLNDTSGNGNHWTGAGNYSFVATPSIPTNITAATAQAISSLPFTFSGETYNRPLWFRYTSTGHTYIGGWGFGGLGTYSPTAYVWAGDGSVEWPNASFQTIAVNVPFQVPMVPGETLYFEFRSDFGGVSAELDVSFLSPPTTTIPAGAFLVTDESPGHGASVISAEDGSVYQFRYPELPASEIGTALTGGSKRILLINADEDADDELYLLDPDLTVITTIPKRGTDVAIAVTSNHVDTFYVAYGIIGTGDDYILRIAHDGTVDETVIGPITDTDNKDVRAMAVNADETRLYYQLSTVNQAKIRAWNLSTNAAAADLVASPSPNYVVLGSGAMVVLPNGNVIAGFDQLLLGTSGFLRAYNSSGVQQWSFDTGALGIDYHGGRVIPAADWPDSIWLIVHFTNGHSRFLNLDTSDGSTLSSFDVATYFTGAYEPAESATPESRFGPAPSCVYISMSEQVEAPEVCVIEQPSVQCWGDDEASVSCSGADDEASTGCWDDDSDASVGLLGSDE